MFILPLALLNVVVCFGLMPHRGAAPGTDQSQSIYRHPSRSSHSHGVKASSSRWQCRMLLGEIAWAYSIKALPTLPNVPG
jgi:hypothetical protein